MPARHTTFWWTLLIVWLVGGIGGIYYAQLQNIPAGIARAALVAFLVEISLYLMPGFPGVFRVYERFEPVGRAGVLVLTAIVPYLIAVVPPGAFSWFAFALLIALASAAAFWYVFLPRALVVDFAFLALMGLVVLRKDFDVIYPDLAPKLPLEVLGQLMWIRLGVSALLLFRRLENLRFGFLPSSGEWRLGALYFAALAPVAGLIGWLTGFFRAADVNSGPWWKMAGVFVLTFAGMLWVVALSEELFFRGLLQQMLSKTLRNATFGLILASVLFGMAHLPFRAFPNWRFALIAGVAGLFYGHVYARTGSIRASMVTHALTATTWRVFLS